MESEQLNADISSRELWFGVAAGPILWFIHLFASYALVSVHCNWRFFSMPMLNRPGILAALIIITLVVFAVVLYAGFTARNNWRRLMRENPDGQGQQTERSWERQHFLSLSGMLLSALFAATILISLIPLFVLAPCAVI